MKRLIVCCDGTWQDSDGGDKNAFTNVTRIARALKNKGIPKVDKCHPEVEKRHKDESQVDQVVYYQSGVGTGGFIDKYVSGSTGLGLSENVREAFGFIAHNYNYGDTIHLFGFSRGAFTARSVCGLIYRLGVLTKRGMDDFHAIYKAYQMNDLGAAIKDANKKHEGKQWFIPNVDITTIGCWDTVGALGVPSLPFIPDAVSDYINKKYSFHDTDLSPMVKHAFQALALDEPRKAFSPSLWNIESNNKITKLKQCWFPGVHTNIGGGYADQEIADMTLAWMVQNHLDFLDFDLDYLESTIIVNKLQGKPDENPHSKSESMKEWAAGAIPNPSTGIMWFAPWKTRTPGEYCNKEGTPFIQTEETIHMSVRIRTKVFKEEKGWWGTETPWECKAMKGWAWDDTEKLYFKGDKKLKEDILGDLEKELAGQDIVKEFIKKAL